MPKSEYTKGPWHYQEESDAYTHIVRGPNDEFILSAPQGTLGECESNARLAAASHELLEDAKSTDQGYTWFREQLENFKAYQGSWTLEVGDNWADSLIAHIKSRQIGTIAAIAKAEGK